MIAEVHIYTDEELPGCSFYVTNNYRIAGNNSANENWNEEKTIELSFDISKMNYVVYPNPCNGIFSMLNANQNDDSGKQLEVTVFDLTGRKTSFQKFHSAPLLMDISPLSPGVYLLKINDGINSYFKKIIYQ